jgi:hypothetical protein
MTDIEGDSLAAGILEDELRRNAGISSIGGFSNRRADPPRR